MSRSTVFLTIRKGDKFKQSVDLERYYILVEDTKFQDAFWDCSEHEAGLGDGDPPAVDDMQWFPAKDGLEYFKHIKGLAADPANIPKSISAELTQLNEEIDETIRLLTKAAKQESTFHLSFCE